MTPSNTQTDLLLLVDKTWRESPRVAEICRNIIAYALTPPVKHYLSWGLLHAASQAKEGEEKELATAIQFLLGDKAHLLSLAFEISDEAGDIVRISAEDAKEALSNNANPLTGDPDPDISSKIYTTFQVAR